MCSTQKPHKLAHTPEFTSRGRRQKEWPLQSYKTVKDRHSSADCLTGLNITCKVRLEEEPASLERSGLGR